MVGGGMHVWQKGECVAAVCVAGGVNCRGHALQRGVHGRGHVW